MAFGVHISETVAAELAAMDEPTSELLLMEMIDLAAAPLERGTRLERDGSVSRRMLGLGTNLILFQVDEDAKIVTILDVVWLTSS
jgi:mRNA-degrading endonuclease RelE of RelBE toxin-antitoxin system